MADGIAGKGRDRREAAAERRFPDHRNKATWGDRIVSIDEFRREAARHGRRLTEAERASAKAVLAAPAGGEVPVEGPFAKVAVIGGVHNNRHALEALLGDARTRGAEAVYCLGDLGGFGPRPEEVRPLLDQGNVRCIQGDHEAALASGKDHCSRGYADPRDKHFARLSYDYTARHCADDFTTWMGRLPTRRRILVGDRQLLLVHGSPRRIDEPLFRSTTPAPFLEHLLGRYPCDGLLCGHTGLPWHTRLPSGRDVVNVGAIGRPANDGRPEVSYALLDGRAGGLDVGFVRLRYDHETLAGEMRAEGLPREFVETILTGWWTTGLEILPAKERSASRF